MYVESHNINEHGTYLLINYIQDACQQDTLDRVLRLQGRFPVERDFPIESGNCTEMYDIDTVILEWETIL
jgi:hypothetical protein